MLIWTIITFVIYLLTFIRFVEAGCYLGPNAPDFCPRDSALPDIDGALLVLMGASGGAYLAGKLVSQDTNTDKANPLPMTPIIEHVLPPQAAVKSDVLLVGNFFGDNKTAVVIIGQNITSGTKFSISPTNIKELSDTQVRFELPEQLQPGQYRLFMNIDGRQSKMQPLEILPPPKSVVEIERIFPHKVKVNAELVIEGCFVGATKDASMIFIMDDKDEETIVVPPNILEVKPTVVRMKMAGIHPGSYRMSFRFNGCGSNWEPFEVLPDTDKNLDR